ncbi:MAG: c-type cytochrome [Flavobacteriaceae bacterium]
MKVKLFLLCTALLVACGSPSEKKKDGFKYNRTQKEETTTARVKNSTPVDLKNKGIGPIKNLRFESKIDQTMLAEGASAFKQKCTACHKVKGKLIGPSMEAIYERRHPAWVMNMLLNPTQMVKEDPIGIALLKEYNNVLMINQNLTQEEARAIVEYLRTL